MDDPYLWLEDVTGDAALDWVRARNAETIRRPTPTDAGLRRAARDGSGRCSTPTPVSPTSPRVAPYLYNFWKDARAPARAVAPDHTCVLPHRATRTWDVLIDLDALAAAEGENWVWSSAQVLRPAQDRVLVSLSRGGADAGVVREFSLARQGFRRSGGRRVPPARGEDRHRLDRRGHRLRRHRSRRGLADRFRLPAARAALAPRAPRSPTPTRCSRARPPTSRSPRGTTGPSGTSGVSSAGRSTSSTPSSTSSAPDDVLTRIDAPTDASLSVQREWLLIRLMTPWTVAGTEYPGRRPARRPLRRISWPGTGRCRWSSPRTHTPRCTSTPGPATTCCWWCCGT